MIGERCHAGDEGVRKFANMVPLAEHIKSIQVTSRVSRAVAQELYELLKGNNSKKSKGGRAKKAKKQNL